MVFQSFMHSLNIAYLLIVCDCYSFTVTINTLYRNNYQRQTIYKRHHHRGHTWMQLNQKRTLVRDLLTRYISLHEDQLETAGDITNETGLYRSFADYAWNCLMESHQHQLSEVSFPLDLCYKEAVPPGPSSSQSKVRITIKAASNTVPESSKGTIQYARYALIETITPLQLVDGDDDSHTKKGVHDHRSIHTDGIQVLNMVIIPYQHTGLPVFGADFVALPGNKHLLLLDAQPVRGTTSIPESDVYDNWFQEWYLRYQIQDQFVWGGDLPEPVQQYVSKFALWTRFGTSSQAKNQTTNIGGSISNEVNNSAGGADDSKTNQPDRDPIQIIQGPVMEAFVNHFQTYLNLLDHYESSPSSLLDTERRLHSDTSRLSDYLQYRLDNDPARPMLKRLFGADWTEQVLHDILFPMNLFGQFQQD
jgi:hypothetical protein